MSYSAPYLDEGGIHLPSYNERLEDLIDGYKRIFGDDVYIGPDTMDYQMLALIAKCWDDLNGLILDVYNARNPNFASGSALDLLLPMNGLMRNAATRSSVVLKLTGSRNAVLPAGMQAIDEDMHIWEISEPVTLDGDGNANVKAYCTEFGAIAAGVGTIKTINTPNVNWYSVDNETEATLGENTETDAALRKRRSASVALPSRSVVSGMKAALLSLNGVESVNIVENNTRDTVNGILPHSIRVVVKGGEDKDIARILWLKKSPGCGMNGEISATYNDEFGNENTMFFSRPTEMVVTVVIELTTFAQYDDSLMTQMIPSAVAEHINKLDIGENLIVGTLNAVIFNANTATYPIFSITKIAVTGNSQANKTDILIANYLTLFRSRGRAQVIKGQDNTVKITIDG